jgi:flavin reductase
VEAQDIGQDIGHDIGQNIGRDIGHDIGSTQVDPGQFRTALGSFATGVSVMTTIVDGVPHGMTASAVSSVSLDPPLVLVCVARDALMATRVLDGGVFALSFLAEDQSGAASAFADPERTKGAAEFADVARRTEATGAPVLDGNVGWVDCRVWSVTDGGDHLVVLGEVLALGTDTDRPLLYYRGAYGEFRPAAVPELTHDTGGAS